jgi:enamine deaminase RidA (YjgF/YER057c/UK114 family)
MCQGEDVITRLSGSAPWEATYGYCRVLLAGGWALTAGTTATGPDGVLHPGDPYAQTMAAFGVALAALDRVGAGADQVVRTRMYVTDARHLPEVGRAHAQLFAAIRPVATMVVVSALTDPLHLVEVELEAYVGGST